MSLQDIKRDLLKVNSKALIFKIKQVPRLFVESNTY